MLSTRRTPGQNSKAHRAPGSSPGPRQMMFSTRSAGPFEIRQTSFTSSIMEAATLEYVAALKAKLRARFEVKDRQDELLEEVAEGLNDAVAAPQVVEEEKPSVGEEAPSVEGEDERGRRRRHRELAAEIRNLSDEPVNDHRHINRKYENMEVDDLRIEEYPEDVIARANHLGVSLPELLTPRVAQKIRTIIIEGVSHLDEQSRDRPDLNIDYVFDEQTREVADFNIDAWQRRLDDFEKEGIQVTKVVRERGPTTMGTFVAMRNGQLGVTVLTKSPKNSTRAFTQTMIRTVRALITKHAPIHANDLSLVPGLQWLRPRPDGYSVCRTIWVWRPSSSKHQPRLTSGAGHDVRARRAAETFFRSI